MIVICIFSFQVASRVLAVPIEKVYTKEASSDRTPNTILTGGSMGTDMYAPAVKACETSFRNISKYMCI